MQQFTDHERLKYNLKGLIISMRKHDDLDIYVSGNSITTVKVTADMNYRSGGQNIPLYTSLFLILVDKGYFCLTDLIGDYLPKTPNGNIITLQMLCNMTSGLADVINDPLIANNPDVFKQWSDKELLHISYRMKPVQPPGKFYFGHITNILLLCTAIQMKIKMSIKKLLIKYIFDPLNLPNLYEKTQYIKEPVLHSFSKYRTKPEYEDATYWNASFASYAGRINANAEQMNILGTAMATGTLLSKQSYRDFLYNNTKNKNYYGMGVAVTYIDGYKVIFSNANIDGYIGLWGYLPKLNQTITIQANTDNIDGFESNFILQDYIKMIKLK